MFKKILIANRGEIACRVIKTAKKMGIQTVSVYSEADTHSLHVKMADEAVYIGPSPSAESYLVIDNIINAIKQTGAEAVHPGFGFLSENAAFANRLAQEGIVFIGPGVEAIGAMGDKIESKKLAIESDVNTIPGHTQALASAEEAVEVSEKIGLPVMLKASAGGGGKGMRVAWTLDEVADSFKSAASEAATSFGDDRVFVEKYIEQPRHIEIQVLADSLGNTVFLGERECSIQRRHQKVIEEAPSPFLDDATRQAMGAQAVALAKAVNYVSAGTVEFIVDKDRNFYFLEMNTRLQVEHPVTEFVTGLDIVEQMIRVASGEALEMTQDDIKLKGWAIEARVYAEDPDKNFMPSIGRLTHYLPPSENKNIRVDTGIYEGSEISMYYDPMIAKLVTYGSDRSHALDHILDALDHYTIRGVSHNIPFLSAIMRHPKFVSGDISTAFIDQEYPGGFNSRDVVHADPKLLVAVATAIQYSRDNRDLDISGKIDETLTAPKKYVVQAGETQVPVKILKETEDLLLNVDGEEYTLATEWKPGEVLFNALINGKQQSIQVDREGIGWKLTHNGSVNTYIVFTERMAELHKLMPVKVPPDLSKFLISPMPGLLVRLNVAEGDEVKAGQELAVVEAMKMENSLHAVQDGVVSQINTSPGDSLAADQAILEFV